jgi:uncharacterized protein (TIGR02099 family)
LRLVFWLALLFGLAWAVAVVTLRYFLLPNIDEYREPIVNSVSKAIGQTVEMARIEGGWRDFRPALNFYGVRVHEAGGLQTLALDRVDTVLSWETLIAGKLVFNLIEFSGSDVEIRRDSLGTLWVAGKAIERKQAGKRSRALSWLLAQEQIVVAGSQVIWVDEMRSVPELIVRDVKLRIENDGQRHRFGLTGKPPAELASAITVNADFFGDDLADFSGQGRLFAEFEYANLAYLQQWMTLPVELHSGLGVLRVWMDIENREIRRIIAEGNLVNVAGRFGANVEPFSLSSVAGRVQWDEDASARTVAMSNLTLETADGTQLAPASVSITTPRQAGGHKKLRIRALDLAPMVALSAFLPVSDEMRERFAGLRPSGVIDQLQASWLAGDEGIDSLEVDGRFSRLAIQPTGKVPGFSGMSGVVSISGGRGSVALETDNAMLDYPQIFAEPIPFDYLNADARWQVAGKRFELNVDNLSFTNNHGAGKARGTYVYPGKGLGSVDIRAVLVRAEARDVWRYFPHEVANARDWLKQGLVAGESDDARLHFVGSLDKFPFRSKRDGIFEITAAAHNATVRIGPDWPLIEGVNGQFLLSGDRIDIKPTSGTIMGADVGRSRVSVLDLGLPEVRLTVDGKASGQVEQYLSFVERSPVASYTRGVTAGMRGSGTGTLGMKLVLPFHHKQDVSVDGALDIAGPRFSVAARVPQLNDYSVKLEFDKRAIWLRNGRANVFGGPMSFASDNKQADARSILLGGSADVRQVATYLGSHARGRVDGRTPWRGRLDYDKAGMHLRIDATLAGVASRLPAPLDKLRANAMPVNLDLWNRGRNGSEYALVIEKVGSARLVTDDGRIVRGEIAFGGQAVLPQENTVLARGTLSALDYDGWRDFMAEPGPGEAPRGTSVIDSLDLAIGTLRFGARTFRDVRISGNKLGEDWQLALSGPQMQGTMLVAADADGNERINARFNTLALGSAEPSVSVPVPLEQRRSERVPAALNVIVEALQFEDKALGRLELLAEPDKEGWRLDRLVITNPDGRMEVKGNWRIAGRSYAEYVVRFEAADIGKFLARLGYSETVVGGTASLSGPVSWLGGPFHPDLPTLSGKLKLQAANGRFAQIDAGAAQLMGILSLQALPRRLSLNFKDVFSTGFSFDSIDADVTISDGVARTDDLRMNGVSAEVTMKGAVNLVTETQDLEVHVKPELSSAAAVAGAAVINPLVGVATLLVQKALGDPVEEAASRDYRVSGTWADPQVERIERTSAAATKPNAPGR